MMREYKVETVRVVKKYAAIIVEAQNERQAIEKARESSDKEFLEVETAESSQWQVKKESFWAGLFSLFSGDKVS